ncbi:hypothetical protein [Streptomyces thermolilacinus]|uniref:hypothetical protein n=1 Tax=Streptomyces thermolilacinus TaxID=285540 RepID=UPI0033C4B577
MPSNPTHPPAPATHVTLASSLNALLSTALHDVPVLHDPELVRWELGVPLRGGAFCPGSITAFVGSRTTDPEEVLQAAADRLGGERGPIGRHFYSGGNLYRTEALRTHWGNIPVAIEVIAPATVAELEPQLAGER